MRIADLLYQIIPKQWFRKMSKTYYKIIKKYRTPLSEKEFKVFLSDKLGVKDGHVLFIHSAMSKLNINFPPARLLEILLETVGNEGTLLFPCWHYIGRAEVYLRDPDSIFDVDNSSTTLGFLNELVRKHPQAVRSMHPTVSICAIGKYAKELTETHHLDIYPCGYLSPWYKMLQYPHVKIIGLGEKVVSLSFVKCVEDILKERFPVQTLSKEILIGSVKKGNEILKIRTLYPIKATQKRDIVTFLKRNISSNAGKMFRYGGMNFFTFDAKILFEELSSLAGRGKTIYM